MVIQRGPPTILIVEDEALVALDQESLVLSVGCRVAGPVARLEDGLRIVQQEWIDGALLDVNLTGNQTSLPLAAELQRRMIPFLFVTAMATDVVSRTFPEIPVVRKPFQPEILRAAVKRLIADN
jgi:DNA-binding response OmpR family regulator